MAIAAAAIITAIVVGLATALITHRRSRSSFNRAIGGRPDRDPVEEHHRIVEAARETAASATARAELVELSLDALTSGVTVTDREGNLLVRNRLAAGATVRSHEQALVDAATTELLHAALRGEPSERELEVYGPPQRILFLHSVPIVDGRQVVGALAVIEDVTEHHRIESIRRDFIANLSHELRTPVGAISLLGEMIADEPEQATRGQLSDRLLAETDRIAATIDDLLALSRIESATESYDDEVALRGLIDDAVARVQVAADARGVSIGTVTPSTELVTYANYDQLLAALVNLLENAVKYSSRDDSISVRCRVDDLVVSLIVQDTGRGIPARDLDRVFERFYRVDRSREASTGGTGIGLSIVRHVAINHGGTVAVQSYEGEGSTFTMTLPFARPSADQPVAPGEAH